ncbi:cytochrome b [Roseobacter sp. CCS2]|uniref:cytochrome b n=1 Tax=Roseobacter sp. CCS2 TaxID=391593 RepID=UPI0000F3E518|nr:cytochrome b [Roseobacter sp. CCS2]EBA11969.1 cytochrome B561 [Roseobacter sp. CCS2]
MTDSVLRYRVPARLIHWTMAILVLGMIPVGFLMVREGLDRSLQNVLFIAHKNIGVLVLILIFVRLIYRWRNPPVLAPVPLPKAQELAAKATHFGLYALLLIMPLAGYVRVRAGGFPIEALDAMGIPALVPRSEALAEFAKAVHFYGAYAIAILVAMHVGAAAYHGLVRRDGIFSRMWPPVGPKS